MGYDVAVIGAGAAGLAAARKLAGTQLKVIVLEARNRVGGRALTDTACFGKPFDRGCGYIHHMRGNPLLAHAKSRGAGLVRVRGEKWSQIWHKTAEVTEAEYDAIAAEYEAVEKAIGRRARRNLDLAVSEALADVLPSPWSPMIRTWLETGCPPTDASLLEWYRAEQGEDYFCTTGLGNLVSDLAQGLEIRLGTPVLEIRHGAEGCRLVTAKGELVAAHVIVTVPHAVLAAESIRFTPSLPGWKTEAIAGIGTAHYAVVGLQFSRGDVLPVPANAWFYPRNAVSDGSLMFINDVAGSGICRAETDGDAALALLQMGEAGAIEHALGTLEAALGSRVRKAFVKGTLTDWRSDPWSRGAWSWAKPGRSGDRVALAAPVGSRLHFAGEACHAEFYATVHGALLSGEDVAAGVARTFQVWS